MKIVTGKNIFNENFWPESVRRKKVTDYTLEAESDVVYHSFYTASPLYRESLLYCAVVSSYRLRAAHRMWLRKPDYLSLRLVLDGNEYVRCEGGIFLAEPGDLMILPPYADYEYRTGNAGFCEKLSITLKGKALAGILHESGLSRKNILALSDVGAFAEFHRRAGNLLIAAGMPDCAALAGLAMELLESLSNLSGRVSEPEKLLKIRQYINQNPGESLSLDDLSRRAGLSPSTLNRLFHARLACSVHQYVMRSRMEYARMLLAECGLSVKESAAATGFSTAFNFSAAFKNFYGVSPVELLRGGKL